MVEMLNEVLVSVLYSYSLRKKVQRVFSLPTEGEFERELLLELAMLDRVMSQSLNVYEERMDVDTKTQGHQNKNKGRVSHVMYFSMYWLCSFFFFLVSRIASRVEDIGCLATSYQSQATASSTSEIMRRDFHGI